MVKFNTSKKEITLEEIQNILKLQYEIEHSVNP